MRCNNCNYCNNSDRKFLCSFFNSLKFHYAVSICRSFRFNCHKTTSAARRCGFNVSVILAHRLLAINIIVTIVGVTHVYYDSF